MLTAFLLSVRQLGDRAVLAVLAKSLALTLAIFAALGTGIYFAIDALATLYADVGGLVLGVAALALTVVLFWLAFRAVAIGVIGLFADDIVAAVERRYYPDAARDAVPVSAARSARMGLASAGRLFAWNLLLSPLYLVLLFTGVGLPLALLIVNGWLLGRDLGDMVASRHLTHAAMRGWRAATVVPRFVLGLAVAGMFVVPGLNLIAPVLGAAMMTHLFHREARG